MDFTVNMGAGECWHYQKEYHFGPGQINKYGSTAQKIIPCKLPYRSFPKICKLVTPGYEI